MATGKGAIWEAWNPRDVIEEVKKVTADNMVEACEFVAEEMRSRAPQRTGRLKRAIDYEVTIESGTIEGHVGVRHGYRRTHVARFLEFGTSKMAARPFMRPALLQNTRQVRQILQGKGR